MATTTAPSTLPPVRTTCHVPLALMASISEETIALWLKLGALEKLEQAVLDGYGDQLCGKTSRIPQVNKFLRQVPLFQNKIKEIHRAVSQGKLREVQHLIDRKKLAFCRDHSGASPLHKAVIFGHKDIIDYLINRYSSVIHARDHQGRTPLHYAAFLPDEGKIYQMLLDGGADERATDVYGRRPEYYIESNNDHTLQQLRDGTTMNGIRKIKPRYYIQGTGNRKYREYRTKQTISKTQIRELIAEGNLQALECLILQGQGDRLLGETSANPTVQEFLNLVPAYMERIQDIHRAVMRDQLHHVVSLLDTKQLATARDQLGATPLHKAIWYGYYQVAKHIAENCPESVNTVDVDGRTPLHYAAALRDNKHMYTMLVEAGANKAIFDSKGKTADYYLQYPEYIDMDEVIKHSHRVNATYLANTANRMKAKSPVRYSPPVSNGSSGSPRSEGTEENSNEGDIEVQNGNTSELFATLQRGSLIKRADMNSANIRKWVQENDFEKIERAVLEGFGEKVTKQQADNEETQEYLTLRVPKMVERIQAIHTAVSNDDLSELQNHLDEKDYALAKDHMGMTPLHRAVLLNHTQILKFLIDKFPETINARNKEGRTALHYAAAISRKDGLNSYKLLTQSGADPKIRDRHGRTADYYKTHLMTMPNKLSIKSRSNNIFPRHYESLNRYSKQGVLERMTSALQRADVDLLNELVLEGYGKHLLGKTSWNEEVRQFLKGLPSYISTIQSLHESVATGDVETVKKLIEENPKLLRVRDENGATPIHLAVSHDQPEILDYLVSNYPVVLSLKDGVGRTALHIVGQRGNQETYKILKEAGADPKILDQKGRTAEYYLNNYINRPEIKPVPTSTHAPREDSSKEQVIDDENEPAAEATDEDDMTKAAVEEDATKEESINILTSESPDVESENNPVVEENEEENTSQVIEDEDTSPEEESNKKSETLEAEDEEKSESPGEESEVKSTPPDDAEVSASPDGENEERVSPDGENEEKNEPSEGENEQKSTSPEENETENLSPEAESEEKNTSPEVENEGRNTSVDEEPEESTPDGGNEETNSPTDKEKNESPEEENTEQAEDENNAKENNSPIENIEDNGEGGEKDENNAEESEGQDKKEDTNTEGEDNNKIEESENCDQDNTAQDEDADESKCNEGMAAGTKEDNESHNINDNSNNENDAGEDLVNKNQDNNETNHSEQENNETPDKETESPQEPTDDKQNVENSESVTATPDKTDVDNENLQDASNEEVIQNGTEVDSSQDDKQTKSAEEERNDESEQKEENETETNEVTQNKNAETSENNGDENSEENIATKESMTTTEPLNDNENSTTKPETDSQMENGEDHNDPSTKENNGDDDEDGDAVQKDHLDELIEHWIKEGDLLRLEHVVLAGQGDRLTERTSEDKQVQDFLDLVPIYMAKIRAVHEAVVKGNLREVRAVLTRKRFALSRDHVGASPLHLAVLHGHGDVASYIISHFPETMDGPDNEGRTPLHYAAVLQDKEGLYRLLRTAGADENVEDKAGHNPSYYMEHPEELTVQDLLLPYKTIEDEQ